MHASLNPLLNLIVAPIHSSCYPPSAPSSLVSSVSCVNLTWSDTVLFSIHKISTNSGMAMARQPEPLIVKVEGAREID
jgi:hypothetical protein